MMLQVQVPAQITRLKLVHQGLRPQAASASKGCSSRALRTSLPCFSPGCLAAGASAVLWCIAIRRLRRRSVAPARTIVQNSLTDGDIEADVVVIGSGLGGLSCAGVLAATGRKVIVCESHYHLGGACHMFREKVKGVGEFHFESGPSLYNGLSAPATPSQLKHVLQVIGEDVEWLTYDRWNAFLPEGEVNVAVGYEPIVEQLLPKYGGPNALEQWQKLMSALKPYSEVVYNGPPFCAIRDDWWGAFTLARYFQRLRPIPGGPEKLSEPFEQLLESLDITDVFIKNYLSMFCFLLQGLPSYGAPTSMMAYMMADLYQKGGTCLDYPKGGSGAIVDALVRGVEKHEGCQVLTKTHVDEILVEGGRACGVRLRGGRVLRAKDAVVSNADFQVTRRLIPDISAVCPELDKYFSDQWKPFPALASFIHIHLGFKGEGLSEKHCPEFPAQWGVVHDWADLEAPRNMVLVSVSSLLDPDCAPAGYHTLHAYTPATEPWQDWCSLDRNSEVYRQKKQEAADFLYSAIERQIPDIRSRVVFESVGTPLTHERFLRKPEGTYGRRVLAGEDLPGHTTPLSGLHLCGDSTFPGIGVPAAALSGHICANNLISVGEHWSLLDRVALWNAELDM